MAAPTPSPTRNPTKSGVIYMQDGIYLYDNVRIYLGTDQDASLYFNGTNLVITGAPALFGGLGFTVNADAAAGSNEDPYLELLGGDGGSELIRSTWKQDSSADLSWFELAGGAAGTTRKTPNVGIGRPGESVVSLDAILTFNATRDAGTAVTTTIALMGEERSLQLTAPSGGTIGLIGAVVVTTGAFSFTGTNIDLDPTGTFALDMDAGQAVTVTLAGSLAATLSLNVGAQPWLRFNSNAASIEYGNSTDNPTHSFLGSGAASFNGEIQTNNLSERTNGGGITLNGEIIGTPVTVSTQILYNTASGALFTVPSGEVWLITDVWFQTATDWNGDGAFIVGVTADTDGFLVMANGSLDPAYDETGGLTGWPTGSRGLDSANRGVLLTTPVTLNPRQFRAVAGTTILLANTTGTSNQGAGTFFMTYKRLL